jgi:hypothetical protein
MEKFIKLMLSQPKHFDTLSKGPISKNHSISREAILIQKQYFDFKNNALEVIHEINTNFMLEYSELEKTILYHELEDASILLLSSIIRFMLLKLNCRLSKISLFLQSNLLN